MQSTPLAQGRAGSLATAQPSPFPRTRLRPHLMPLGIALLLTTCLPSSPDSFAHAQTQFPKPVAGFAICQTPNALHIQGGIAYSNDGSHLRPTNQHFRLDLSQPFSASTPPTWVNMTSDLSPIQAYHTGACTTDMQSFLTVGNAMENGKGASFMRSYSLTKGTWEPVSKALTDSANVRTMVGFAISKSRSSSFGLVVGGSKMRLEASTASSPATETLSGWQSEMDFVNLGSDGSVESLTYTAITSSGGKDGKDGKGGKGGKGSLGAIAATSVVILSGSDGSSKALILGGLSSASEGISFSNLPVVDLNTMDVSIQNTKAGNNASIPPARYGHCAVLAPDGNTVIMYGGVLLDSDKPLNDVFVLDTRSWTWSQPAIKGTSLPPPVRNHQCVMVGDQLITLFGFNRNGVPQDASGNSASTLSVLSTSQWSWSNNFVPSPNTQAPPPPPQVPKDGSGGKVNGLAVGFGVVFSLAFLSVIIYSVWAHQRRKLKKREVLVLIEMEKQQKAAAEEEKKKKKDDQSHNRDSQQDLMEGPVRHDNYHYNNFNNDYNYGGGQEYNPYYANTVATAPPPAAATYHNTQYAHHDMYNNNNNHHLVGGYSADTFSKSVLTGAEYPLPLTPSVPPKPGQENTNHNHPYVAEEMGSSSYENSGYVTSQNRYPPGPAPHPHYAGITPGTSRYRDSGGYR